MNEAFDNGGIISLRKWPDQPFNHRKCTMSPLSHRILDDCGIIIEQILPQSFDEYVSRQKIINHSYEELLERFHQFQQRRYKKVAMLQKLRFEKSQFETHELLTKKMLKSSKWMKSTKSTKGTNQNSNSKSKEKQKASHLNLKLRQKNFTKKNKEKIRLADSQNDYFGQYRRTSTSKSLQSKKSNKKKDKGVGSNKIQHKKNVAYTPIDEYYDSTGTNRNIKSLVKGKKSLSMELQILEEMQKCIKNLNELDTAHAKQIEAASQLSEKYKKRLRKIHIIEKEQMKLKMKEIRAKLTKCSNFIRGIQMTKSH